MICTENPASREAIFINAEQFRNDQEHRKAILMEKLSYHFKPFTVFDELSADRSSNKDNKDQFECSIDVFYFKNKFVSYSWIFDIHVCVLHSCGSSILYNSMHGMWQTFNLSL